MPTWIIGYAAGAYTSMTEIPLNVPGPIRRISTGFYVHRPGGVVSAPVALTPVITADADNEIQIFTQKSVKIFIAAGLTDPMLFLFVETELEYLSKNPINP